MAIPLIPLQGLMSQPLGGAVDRYKATADWKTQRQNGREDRDLAQRQRTAQVLGRALESVEAAPPDMRQAALDRYKTVALGLEPGAAQQIGAVTLDDLPALRAATTQEMTALQQFQLEQAKTLAPYNLEEARLGVDAARLGLDASRLGMDESRLGMTTRQLQNEGLRFENDTKRAQRDYYAGGGVLGDMGAGGGGAAPVADGGSIVAQMFPGARITSTRRAADDPLTKANPDSWHAKSGGAVDVAPIPGVTFEEYVGRLRDGGYEIIEAINETGAGRSSHATGDHWHVVLGGGPAGAGGGAAGGAVPGAAPAGGGAAGGSVLDRAAADPKIQALYGRLAQAQAVGDTAGAQRVTSLIELREKELVGADAKDAPSGYRYGPDGQTLQAIPGGPADPAVRATGKGGSVVVDPATGQLTVQPADKPLTESQSKDVYFLNRAESAGAVLDRVDTALASYGDTAAGAVPFVGNAMVSQDYQVADQAADEFIASLLRKESGAAVPDNEMARYRRTYLPQPGDSAETVERKRAARRTAKESLRMGLGVIANRVDAGGGSAGTAQAAPSVGAVIEGYRFKGGNPALESSWEPVN